MFGADGIVVYIWAIQTYHRASNKVLIQIQCGRLCMCRHYLVEVKTHTLKYIYVQETIPAHQHTFTDRNNAIHLFTQKLHQLWGLFRNLSFMDGRA